MTDEVKAAAERYRANRDRTGTPYAGKYPNGSRHFSRSTQDADRKTLADAYLTEHPADDGEPITEDWLVVCGFRKTEDREHRLLLECGNDLVIEEDLSVGFGYGEFGDGGEYLAARKPLKTRGDLRRLCAALGIPLAH